MVGVFFYQLMECRCVDIVIHCNPALTILHFGFFEGVESVPVMTSVQSSSGVGRHLTDLLTLATKLDIRRLHRAIDSGLEADEYKEVLENLQTAAHCYETETMDML